jgi:hypothetical protein
LPFLLFLDEGDGPKPVPGRLLSLAVSDRKNRNGTA